MDSSLPKNRLGLAKWLFSNENPLTSRVTVNRYWQMIFGYGLVRTPEDFGVQGMLPSHPELLDWLSIYLIENNWDIKKLIKLMVMSHVYQQKSNSNDKLNEIDPNNFFLARSNSYKLPAEIIRDNALSASGLLVKKVGGPSVKPYQPEGLWLEKNSFSADLYNYKKNSGDSLYRRGMYTFIKRTSPPPSMIALDGTSREVCTVRREKTNTPLQALVLMNDPQFFEASRIFAELMIKSKDTLEEQIGHGFRLATSRHPKDEELEIDVRGRNLAEGIPRQLTLRSNQIQEAISEPLAQIIGAVKNALEQSPPELASDIAERGIVLTGGGALLNSLDALISKETGLPVLVADDPLTCVARGGGSALEIIDKTTFNLFNSE